MDHKLHLGELAKPRLSEALLHRAARTLHEIKTRNEARYSQGGTSRPFEIRKERLRNRLQGATRPEEQFWKIVKTEVGWQRLLLSLYLDHLGAEWLRPFDAEVAAEVMGKPGEQWHPSRRRQVTHLFFQRFDLLSGLAFVCQRLRESYAEVNAELDSSVFALAKNRDIVFDSAGATKVASLVQQGETLHGLCERFAVPAKGRFIESLRQLYLLESLKKCRLGDDPPALEQIEAAKPETALESLRLGAAALRIIVRRVANEGRGRWPNAWQKWIVRLGCDPRLGRSSAEGAKWWGWATDAELRLAQQGVIGLSLRFFFDFLDGTVSVSQWRDRRKFLESLFDAGKIIDARLVLNWSCLQRLEPRLRDPWSIAHLSATTDETSMIALRCTEEVFIIEGTHNYGLRAFHRQFPVRGFWERSKKTYQDNELRISPSLCPVFVAHVATGSWVSKFFRELRYKFHVEWGDVHL